MQYQGTAKQILEQLYPIQAKYIQAIKAPKALAQVRVAFSELENAGKNFEREQRSWYARLCVLTFFLILISITTLGIHILTFYYSGEKIVEEGMFLAPIGAGLILGFSFGGIPSKYLRTKKVFYNMDYALKRKKAKLFNIDTEKLSYHDSVEEKAYEILGLDWLPYGAKLTVNGINGVKFCKLIKDLEQGLQSPVTVVLGNEEIQRIKNAQLVIEKLYD